MSEIRLNLLDLHKILAGTIHGSIGDRCVAALSAEPETIDELETALERFERNPYSFQSSPQFAARDAIDTQAYDAGILIIDLTARIVAYESTYSQPAAEGYVNYHDGLQETDVPIYYLLPDDWVFLDSVPAYQGICVERRRKRLAVRPVDARPILYGPALLEFVAENLQSRFADCHRELSNPGDNVSKLNSMSEASGEPLFEPEDSRSKMVSSIHAQWLLTPREDLRGQSPRNVLLAKQDFINRDLESREFQWEMQLQGPPGLPTDSFAYRFGGFGTQEWVLYYDLVRHLIWSALTFQGAGDKAALINHLELVKTEWLNEPNDELEGHVPVVVIENERRRLPEAMGGRSMVIDEDCPLCKMMGDESEAGLGVYFWHLDRSHMDEEFAFSSCATEAEYLEEMRRRELIDREIEQRCKEREERLARGEILESDSVIADADLSEFAWPFELEPERPES